MEGVPSAADASTQEHNARVVKNWLEYQEMSTGKAPGGKPPEHVAFFSLTINSEVKPETNKSPEDVLPIWARQLTAGACHRKRRLTGVVIEDAIFTGVIYFVMNVDAVNLLQNVTLPRVSKRSSECTVTVHCRRIACKLKHFFIICIL